MHSNLENYEGGKHNDIEFDKKKAFFDIDNIFLDIKYMYFRGYFRYHLFIMIADTNISLSGKQLNLVEN